MRKTVVLAQVIVTSFLACSISDNAFVRVLLAKHRFGTRTQASNTVSVKDFGAKGDLRNITDSVMTRGSNIVSSPAQAQFTPSDVGKWVQVSGAANGSGTALSAQITTVQNTTSVLLSAYAGASVSNVTTTIATDDYAALKAAASSICNTGGTLLFPRGTYYVAEYKVTGGTRKNSVSDIQWNNCNGVTVSGYGAQISVNGSFRRTADSGFTSYENSVIPFDIIGSNNFHLVGLELNGNVDKTTKDVNVIEGWDYGVHTDKCTGLTFRDMNVHHFATDGFLIGAGTNYTADKNVVIDHVWSHNNARQGISLIQVSGVTVTHSQFTDTGFGRTGNYGGHPPQAGMDIEPNVASPPMDVPTENVVIRNNVFRNNAGNALVAAEAGAIANVTVSSNVFDSTQPGSGIGGGIYLLEVANGKTLNNMFSMRPGVAFACPNSANSAIQRLDIIGNTFSIGKNHDISCPSTWSPTYNWPIYFVRNHVRVMAPGPDNSKMYLNGIACVVDNDFYVDARGSYHSVNGKPNPQYIQVYSNTQWVAGNTYTTNLRSVLKYGVDYTNTIAWVNEKSLSANYKVIVSGGRRQSGNFGVAHLGICPD